VEEIAEGVASGISRISHYSSYGSHSRSPDGSPRYSKSVDVAANSKSGGVSEPVTDGSVSATHSQRMGGNEVFADVHIPLKQRWLEHIVLSPQFEIFFALLIVLNTLAMALEAQYDGVGLGHELKYKRYDESSTDAWPGLNYVFDVADIFFGILFLFECVIKMIGLRIGFFCDRWNVFDLVIVLGWLFDAVGRKYIALPLDPMLLRLARLARLLRLMKLIKSIKGIDPLFLMVTTLKSSCAVLFWVSILMLVVQTMFALLMNQILVSYYLNTEDTLENKQEIFKYFGSFSRAMLSMFEITFGNWPPIARLLHETVTEWFLIFLYCISSLWALQ
jgi:hypothetical protein